MTRRIALHLAFWLAYLLISGYIESMLAGSTLDSASLGRRLALGYTVELLALPIKMLAVYWFLYRLIPRYLEGHSRLLVAAEGLGAMVSAVVLYRLLIQFGLYPYLYGEEYSFSSWPVQLSRYLWAFLDVFYIVGVAGAIRLFRLRLEAEKREQQLMQEKWQSELRFLRAQTNPHFLFNTLNNIYGLARRQSPHTAEVVMKLSKLLRYMIYECSETAVPLSKELKMLESYIGLQRLRYDGRLAVKYTVEVEEEGQSVAPLLLLPLIENAFKHGAGESRSGSYIDIRISLCGGKLRLQVNNSVDKPSGQEGLGIGLKNLRRQLELLYPGQFTLDLKPMATAYEAQLTINLTKDAYTEMPYC